jgi:hypothetical protein
MKKLVFISGGLSGSLTGLGILFKIMHYPGAGILLLLGLGILSTLYIPSLTKYLYDRSK